jgi:hypothetical protein
LTSAILLARRRTSRLKKLEVKSGKGLLEKEGLDDLIRYAREFNGRAEGRHLKGRRRIDKKIVQRETM